MSTLHPNFRTTILQAFARTVVDESRQGEESGSDPSPRPETPLPPSALVLPVVGDVVGEHYKLVRLLGQGMFGKVYVAQRLDVPEHQVALKLLPRSLYAGRNVDRELVMLATVGHPHVVQLKDHGTTGDFVWLTMPVYQGETLAERLTRGPLGLREAHDIFLPIARGLDALHSAGLRHQDIKPENIFLATFGGLVHPIILDLGVAAEKDAPFVAGTALYAAPEQVAVLSGAHPWAMPLSEKMDTYGLAATLLVALVGPELFPGEAARDREQLTKAHTIRANEPLHPDALPDLVGRPRELISKALARWMAIAPADRPAMSELAEQLDILLEPEREEQRQEEQRRTRQRATIQRLKVGFGAIALLGMAGVLVMYSKRETIELAGKLQQAQDQARKEGERSFDKIETCNAAHRMATMDASSCRSARDKDRSEFKKSLDEVAKSGNMTQAESARQVQAYAAKIKTCEDTVTATQRACTDEAARFADESTKQKAALEKARDEQKQLTEAAKARITALEQERDKCSAERLTCSEERDTCRAATRPSSIFTPGPVSSSGGRPVSGGSPSGPSGSPGSVVPATTSAPTSTSVTPQPPPPPPPPAPPRPVPRVDDPYGPGP